MILKSRKRKDVLPRRRGHKVGTRAAKDVLECPSCGNVFLAHRHAKKCIKVCPKCGFDGSFHYHTSAELEKPSDGETIKRKPNYDAIQRKMSLSAAVNATYGFACNVKRIPDKGLDKFNSYKVVFKRGGKEATIVETLTERGLTGSIEVRKSGQDQPESHPSFDAAEKAVISWLRGP